MKQSKSGQSRPQILKRLRLLLTDIKCATVLEMLFALMTIPLGLTYITSEYETKLTSQDLRILLCGLFLALALARLFLARRMRLMGKPKLKIMTQRMYVVAFLICSALPIFVGYTQEVGFLAEKITSYEYKGDVRQLIALVYWSALFIGRLLSVIEDHRWQKLIPNILLMVIILIMGLSTFLTCDMIYAMLIIVTLSLAEIFSVVFARLHVATLQKIVRKTYAAEIILGLLLLIVAFAYVLTFTDSETIPTFIDGIWYCFAIVTTIGFGDFTVTTLVGRVLSMVLGVYGIIVVALITSIIVNFYGEMKKEPEHSGEQLIEKEQLTAEDLQAIEDLLEEEDRKKGEQR